MSPVRKAKRAKNADHVKYEKLKAFIEEHDRLPRKREKTSDGFAVGQWVYYMRDTRKQFRDKHPELAALIEQLPHWEWYPCTLEDNWQNNYELLREFITENGRIPAHTEMFRKVRIGLWARTQRYMYRKVDVEQEPYATRVQLLNDLPGWHWDRRAHRWNARLAELRQYYDTWRDLPSPTTVFGDKSPLGQWLQSQIRARQRGKLSPERSDCLDAFLEHCHVTV